MRLFRALFELSVILLAIYAAVTIIAVLIT